ncbi:adenylate kinase 9 [Scyliorhinus canicula]|uniref:adenylate kinase 9 n=1 Tax=Scyliorhinus canicula TaxID=7830 RepID=UPI0018F66276|nr:adenylate kinase 9 [Scyliorhinus canicula]
MKSTSIFWESHKKDSVPDFEDLTYLWVGEDLDLCQVVDDAEAAKHKKKKEIFTDLLDEDEIERKILLSKPTCFLIVGKPSVGKTTLAKSLAEAWNKILVEPVKIIQENTDGNTETGQKFQESLLRGESIPEELVMNLMMDKLRSPEVAHHGYVLCEFPTLSENYLNIPDQIQLLKSLTLKPDFIINIKCPDYDLCERVSGQRQDPLTGKIYQREQWDPEKINKEKMKGEAEEEENEEEEEIIEELEEEETAEGGMSLAARLVRRPEDLLSTIEKNVAMYKDKMLRLLEDYMTDHDHQNIIELDGNKKTNEIFMSVMYKLEFLGLQPAALVQRLHDDEEEETPEEIDDEDLFRSVAVLKRTAPGYRWRRSKWGRACPVSLFEGNIVMGKLQFSASYLDKMYFLSSEEALKKFISNPRPYLLPPHPRPPCKVAILGPKSTGKTTLCKLIAQKYDAKVLDMFQLLEPQRQKLKFDNIEQVRADTVVSAILTVRNKLEKTMLEEAQAEFERQAAFPVGLENAVIAEEDEDVDNESKGRVTEGDSPGSPSENPEKAKIMEDSTKVPFDIELESCIQSKQMCNNLTLYKLKNVFSSLDDFKAIPVSVENVTMLSLLKKGLTRPAGVCNTFEIVLGFEMKCNINVSTHWTLTSNSKYDQSICKAVRAQLKIPDVTEDHPDVQEILNKAVQKAMEAPVELPMNAYMDALIKAISEISEERQVKNPDHPVAGGWVLDDFPERMDHCKVMIELGFAPDNIFLLSNAVNDGNFLLNRLYNLNKDLIEVKMLHRLKDLAEKIKLDQQAMLEASREAESQQMESQETKGENEADEEMNDPTQSNSDHSDTFSFCMSSPEGPQKTCGHEITLPEVPEGSYPEGQEMNHYRKIIAEYINSWNGIERILTTTIYTILEIAEKTPNALLEEVIHIMGKPFKYYGWELSGADLDEEEEDAEAMADEAVEEAGEEEEEEEEEGEEEENEDFPQRKNRVMGESKHYCPVALEEKFVLFPGDQEAAAKYREKYYYFSNSDAREKFLKNPEEYLNNNESLKSPPLRLCVFGPKGCGKSMHSRWLANKLGIFHIQFTELLQEYLFPKFKKKVGPEYDDEPTEEELADMATIMALERGEQPEDIEVATEEKQEEVEVELTPEEEAMKAYLLDDEPLSTDLLNKLLPKWWTEEPYKSKGFILDGFPATTDEVQYLASSGLFPDAAIYIKIEEANVINWILPPRLAKWKEKHDQKLERRNKIKELKKKLKDEKIAKRREELLAERDERKKENQATNFEESSEESNGSDEEDEENIEDILADEFSVDEEEEDEEEEEENDAIDRLKTEIVEKYDADQERIFVYREQLRESLMPCIVVEGKYKPHIVQYKLNKKVQPLVKNRASLFEKCFPVNLKLVHKLLKNSYKLLSSFGLWDVVELSNGTAIQPILDMHQNVFPLLHRKYIYYFVTKENRDKFIENPLKYICQPKPRPVVPIKIAIVGPPKSGKSTVARKFAREFGLQRISAGDVVRTVLLTQKKTELAVHINEHLKKGLIVPDVFVTKCLEVVLMDIVCSTRGFILDGYPVTRQQIGLMSNCKIIPVKIIELQTDIKEILKRGLIDKKSPDRVYPLHDSSQILTVRNSSYTHEISAIWEYYYLQHQNWHIIYGHHSKWWVWEKVLEIVKASLKQIEIYLERIQNGKAACIAGLCITPTELQSRVGVFQQYCPVTLQLKGELVDCSVDPSLEFSAEFQGHYYKMSSKKALNIFLNDPEMFLPPLASHSLPDVDMLPVKLNGAGVKARFPKQAEFQGYCPVTFLDGKQKYEALVPGHIDYAAEYRDRLYIFQDEEHLDKFMRLPDKYWDLALPNKLPPVKEPVFPTSLPMLGYMEQGVALSIIKALTAVGCLKPKYPFLSVKKSALLYIAYHLKAHNPKSYDYVKKKYVKILEQYEEHCELISYLGSKMTRKYREPKDRPVDFDRKLQAFLALKHPNSTIANVP